ncbi:MAG: hypothetical protein QOF42_1221 [Gammaproteobacteria bacterium]|nr:hypothetical protein [Gammaproteobacteria bacterium]
MSSEPLSAAIKGLLVQDIFLISSKCLLQKDFNQTQPMHALSAQTKHAVEQEVLVQVRATVDGKNMRVVRYFTQVGFRFMESLETGAAPEAEGKVVGEIDATFAADYQWTSEQPIEPGDLGSFSPNVMYHVWPYWREFIQNSLSRMRLPPVALPMLRLPQLEQVISGKASVTATQIQK